MYKYIRLVVGIIQTLQLINTHFLYKFSYEAMDGDLRHCDLSQLEMSFSCHVLIATEDRVQLYYEDLALQLNQK